MLQQYSFIMQLQNESEIGLRVQFRFAWLSLCDYFFKNVLFSFILFHYS